MRFRKKHEGDPELNIIPFLNVMVVLIAFLLVNAVFAAVAVLDVNLPSRAAASSTPPPDKPQVNLEVSIYKNFLEVSDHNTGPIKRFDNINGKADIAGMHQLLVELKKRFSDDTKISLLCENDTPYQLLISVMDAARYVPDKVAGHEIRRPLFPDISIGSAPPLAANPTATNTAGGTP